MISSGTETDTQAVTENPANVMLRNREVTQFHFADEMHMLDPVTVNKTNNGSQSKRPHNDCHVRAGDIRSGDFCLAQTNGSTLCQKLLNVEPERCSVCTARPDSDSSEVKTNHNNDLTESTQLPAEGEQFLLLWFVFI